MRPLFVLAAVLAAFGPPQDPPRQVFRSGVDLVTVDAVVFDRDGSPVTDLTAADFTVSANKQIRKVRSAEFIAVSNTRAAAAAAADGEPVPSVSTNVGQPEARSFLIVVDVDRIGSGGGKVALRATSDFVESLGPNDLAGVVALPTGRPRVELTREREPLRQAMGLIVGVAPRDGVMSVGEAAAIASGDRSAIDEWAARKPCAIPKPDCALPGPIQIADKVMRDERRHSRDLFSTLRALSDVMAPLKGLKTIVLVSEGMVRDHDVNDDVRRFAEAAARARVTLYSLTLDIPLTEAADDMTRPPDRRRDVLVKTNGMADAARAAGGDMFLISGTPDNALKRIDRELAGYYLLSFESDPSDASDKRKNVEVKVRRPGVTVRTRTDYSVPLPAPAKPAAPVDLRARMGDLMRQPVAIADIPIDFVTFASPAAPSGPERRVILVAELPKDIQLAAAGFEITDAGGKVVKDSFEPKPSLTAGPVVSTYYAAVPLAPGRYQVKFGIVASDDRRGSIMHSLWVKASAPGSLRMGDLVVGNEDADGFKPIARLQDGTTRLTVHVELQATEGPAFDGASVLLDIVRKGETAPFTSATMPTEETDNPLRRIATAALTIGRLPAGEYIVRATLQGGASSERVTRLVVKK